MLASEVGTVTIVCGIVTGTVLRGMDCCICLIDSIRKQNIVRKTITIMHMTTRTGIRKITTVPTSATAN